MYNGSIGSKRGDKNRTYIKMDFHCQLCGQTCKNKEEHALHFKGKRHGKMKEMLMYDMTMLSKEEIDAKYGHDQERLAYIIESLGLTPMNSNVFD